MPVKVLSGIDRIDLMDKVLKGRRVAVVTSGGAVNKDLVATLDVLVERYNVVKLFNAIYGVRGDFRYGETTPEYVDEKTGLTAYSIFCMDHVGPTAEMVKDVDVIVFDIREAGTRFFEYISLVASLMKACAAHKVPLVVLDRIAPIGGSIVEGTVCPPTMHNIVGDYELPSRIALTIGEFARYVNGEYGVGCDLTVIPVEGWKRNMYYDETDVPWLLPSPSLNCVNTNILYAGYCAFEGIASLSEGRGTSKPFELVGAPWLNAGKLVSELKKRDLPGIRFADVYFMPTASKHAKQLCYGIQSIITDRNECRPFLTALTIIDIIREMHPENIVYRDVTIGHTVREEESFPVFTRYIDKILATDAFSTGKMNAKELNDFYAPAREKYIERKKKYELYE